MLKWLKTTYITDCMETYNGMHNWIKLRRCI